MEISLQQLPIPDWGLECPRCAYPLKGLPAHRCPECGTAIDVPSLVHPWTRLRPPRFTGHESPLPDFGLACSRCRGMLVGAIRGRCPHCGAPFDVETLRPQGVWFILDRFLCRELPIPGVLSLLASEYVPYAPALDQSFGEIIGGTSIMVTRLRVASEFYFEMLWLLQDARRELYHLRMMGGHPPWRCPACHEENPGHFEMCWNCQMAAVGRP